MMKNKELMVGLIGALMMQPSDAPYYSSYEEKARYEAMIIKDKKRRKTIDKFVVKLNNGCRVWEFDINTKRHINTMTKNQFTDFLHSLEFSNNELVLPNNNTIFVIALNRKNAYRKAIKFFKEDNNDNNS